MPIRRKRKRKDRRPGKPRPPRVSWPDVDAMDAGALLDRLERGLAVVVRKNKARPYELPPRRHPFHEIFYVDSGAVTVTVGRRRLRGRQGDLFWLPAGTRHGRVLPAGGRASVVIVNFLGLEAPLAPLAGRRVHLDTGARETLGRALARAEPDEGGAVVLKRERLRSLLAALRRGAERPGGTGAEAKHTLADRRAAVEAACEEIGRRLDRPPNLSELAARAGFSRYHFSRVFREVAGMPMRDYVSERRMDRARELLASGGLNVTQVSEALGFGTVHYFSRAFKRRVGIPPSEYAERLRGLT